MKTIATVRELNTVRGEIDEIDRSLLGLIATRLDLAQRAGLLKEQGGLTKQDPARRGRGGASGC